MELVNHSLEFILLRDDVSSYSAPPQETQDRGSVALKEI